MRSLDHAIIFPLLVFDFMSLFRCSRKLVLARTEEILKNNFPPRDYSKTLMDQD